MKARILSLDHLPPKVCLTKLKLLRTEVRELEKPVWLGVRGTAERRLTRLDSARVSLSMAFRIARRAGSPREDLGDLLLRSGTVAGADGDFPLAYGLAREAAQEFMAAGCKEGVGRSLVNQGQWLNHLGEIDLSEEAFLAAGKFLGETQHDHLYAMNQGLAVVRYQKSDTEGSLRFVEEAKENAYKADSRDFLKIKWIEAWLMEEMGEIEEAHGSFVSLFEKYKESENFVESVLSGLEACRLVARMGGDLEGSVEMVCSLIYSHDHIPPIFESLLVDLYHIRKKASLKEIIKAISILKGTSEGKETPRMFSRTYHDYTVPEPRKTRPKALDLLPLDQIPPRECLSRLRHLRPLVTGLDKPVWLGLRGSAKRRLSQLDDAWTSLSTALKMARRKGSPRNDLGDLLLRAGTVAGASGDFSLSYGLAREAALEFAFFGSKEGVGRSLVNQGQWLHHLEEESLSEEAFLAAGQFLAPTQYDQLYAMHLGLAVIQYHRSDLQGTAQFVEVAKQNAKKANSRDLLKIRWTEAWLMEEMGEHEKAYGFFIDLFEHYEQAGNIVESALAGLEACRIRALEGDGLEEAIELVSSLVGNHKKVPKIAESVLLNLYAIRKRAQLQDISVSISKIRRAPEGKLAPRMFNRQGQQMGQSYGS